MGLGIVQGFQLTWNMQAEGSWLSVGQIKQEVKYGKNNSWAVLGAQHLWLIFPDLKNKAPEEARSNMGSIYSVASRLKWKPLKILKRVHLCVYMTSVRHVEISEAQGDY